MIGNVAQAFMPGIGVVRLFLRSNSKKGVAAANRTGPLTPHGSVLLAAVRGAISVLWR